MDLKTKWHARQIAIELLSYLLCFTTVAIIVPVAIAATKFMTKGRGMYEGLNWPRGADIDFALKAFWQLSAWPFVRWLPVALLGDVLLRRFAYKLRS